MNIKILKLFGIIGYIGKFVFYTILSILCIKSSVNMNDDFELSPNGVFSFILLYGQRYKDLFSYMMFFGMISYSIWRFLETFQKIKSEIKIGRISKFFRFRLSPFVSGIMYIVYSVYIIKTLQRIVKEDNYIEQWKTSILGLIGLGFLGLGFISASISQFAIVLQMRFLQEFCLMEMNVYLIIIIVITGTIGFLGRAILFALISTGLIQIIFLNITTNNSNYYYIGFHLLQSTDLGRLYLTLLGTCLLLYSIFLFISIFKRDFPTKIFDNI